jgi:sporulation protein YlmC with PRC-barrel domain
MLRLSDLVGAEVRTAEGEHRGRIHEVVAEKGRVTLLVCGVRGFGERLGLRRPRGAHVPWSEVREVRKGTVVIRGKEAG